MAKIKLTKSAVDAAQPRAQAVELRDPAQRIRCSTSGAAWRHPGSDRGGAPERRHGRQC